MSLVKPWKPNITQLCNALDLYGPFEDTNPELGMARAFQYLMAEHPMAPNWFRVDQQLPPDDTPVLLLVNGVIQEGTMEWERPGFEETFDPYPYFTVADERCCFALEEVTHWMPKPALPTDGLNEDTSNG